MVVLVTLLQASQDRDRRELVRLIHHHRLETAFKSLILFKVFLVLIECGGTNSTQLTTSQCRLQNVGSIHSTLTTAGTYQRMNLVDKQDNTTFGLRHLIDDTLQTFLKLALVLGTSNQRTHIKGIELFVL